MTKPWADNFDFYLTQFDDDLVAVMVDLAAGEHLPLERHPTRVRLMIEMQQPMDNGLRSPEEADRLFALEDALVDRLEAQVQAIYVGRVLLRGLTDLVFYAPRATAEAIQGLIAPLQQGYAIDVEVADDAGWTFYQEVMAPDVYAQHQITNRRVMQQLSEAGDDHTRVRIVDHLVYLPSQGAAEQAAAGLADAAFAVDPPQEGDDGAFALSFRDQTPLADGQMDDRVGEILDVVLPLEGVYDGWGCTVEKSETSN